jgi:hypothetical protein
MRKHSVTVRRWLGAHAALALHYNLTGKIVPPGGSVFVYWYTNEKFIKRELPTFLIDELPLLQTRSAGKQSLRGSVSQNNPRWKVTPFPPQLPERVLRLPG